MELIEIKKRPYKIMDTHVLKSKNDIVRLFFYDGEWKSKDFERQTLLNSGFVWSSGTIYRDNRSFNGGKRQGSGAKSKDPSLKKIPFTSYHERWKIEFLESIQKGKTRQLIEDCVSEAVKFYQSKPKV